MKSEFKLAKSRPQLLFNKHGVEDRTFGQHHNRLETMGARIVAHKPMRMVKSGDTIIVIPDWR